MDFPIFKTKIDGLDKKFNLTDPKEQEEYFRAKAGEEIKKIQEYLNNGNTFIAYLLGKKNSGKGTYSKMFSRIIDPEKVDHFSVGDMIRSLDADLKDKQKKKELIEFLEKNYRGLAPLKDVISALEKRNTKVLLPTDLILTLAKREIAKKGRKSIFIDGFPRDMDQINFSLFFRDLIGYRDDPDVFVLIDVPDSVIDERIKYRRICPNCQTSRNYKLLPTSIVEYDKGKKEFNLFCDNPSCQKNKMVAKEGDEEGVAPIMERLKTDATLIGKAQNLCGVPKVFLRNSIPEAEAKNYVDDYEVTPEYVFEYLESEDKVNTIEKPWVVKDNSGTPSVSLLAPPVVVSLIKQLTEALNL